MPAAPCAKYEPMVNQKCKELVKNLTQQVELLTKTTQSIEGILVEQKEKKTSSHEIKEYLELIKEVKEKNVERTNRKQKEYREKRREQGKDLSSVLVTSRVTRGPDSISWGIKSLVYQPMSSDSFLLEILNKRKK